MNKEEFLETLSIQLSGQMQEGRAAAHVQYYRNYIEEQMRNGRSEGEVLAELGDPRLIAKTLVDTDADAGQEVYESSRNEYQGYYGEDESRRGHVKRRSYHLDLSAWYGKLAVIAIAVVVIGILIAIASAVLPFFIIFGIIIYVLSRFRKS